VLPAVLIILLLLVLAGLLAGAYFGWFGKIRFGGFSSVLAQDKPRAEAPAPGMLRTAVAPAPEKPQVAVPAPGMLLVAVAPAPERPPATAVLAPELPPAVATPADEVSPAAAVPVDEVPPAAAPEKKGRFEPQVIKLVPPVPVNIAPESSNPPPPMGGEPGATDSPSVPSAPSEATLRLLFNASTLAQVRDSSGKLIFNRSGIKGSTSSVKGTLPLTVMVKQASNVKLEFNGEIVDLKGHTSRDGIARLTLQ
jgi:cytoskeleton protein RodZ